METSLITHIALVEETIFSRPKPAIRYRVTAETESGQLVLWISEDAAKQLRGHLEAQLRKFDTRRPSE